MESENDETDNYFILLFVCMKYILFVLICFVLSLFFTVSIKNNISFVWIDKNIEFNYHQFCVLFSFYILLFFLCLFIFCGLGILFFFFLFRIFLIFFLWSGFFIIFDDKHIINIVIIIFSIIF